MSKTKGRAPIHVCSLSMSPLTAVQKDMREVEKQYNALTPEQREKDVSMNDKINRLRWVQLSIEYNRQIQLQYVYQHLGDKGNNPRFRQVRMKPLFNAWKREILRQKWLEVRKAVDTKALDQRLTRKFDAFSAQRAELAARSVARCDFLKDPPLKGLIDIADPLAALSAFQTPDSNQTDFYNKGYDFVQSSAVNTISELPTQETNEEPLNNEEIRQRLKSRGIELPDKIEEAPPVEEEVASVKKLSTERSKKDSGSSDSKKGDSKSFIYVILAVVLAVIAVGVVIYITKARAAEARRIAQLKCATPTPAPKRGWFGK
ncbi:hypothetical protein TVAG_094080 [Trichomonas vaginalis G3]|uniref:Uncharacterized protein n=1 Tax=Trichomonas vaginalis (strain ATCC PRA-98 / G3) TaxID=412133 RepID=A2DBN0_TRIV3|nr:hypothetical protein TVAGG3_0381540 [Trichomonas vaginalis G3]EAY22233.1 hypothetical protein TVAG_094080 [Trichomonas vaginalis G3]KAI5533309.1 hypothetical protein TVAGG3_0381540 [Trichomonas vaginalis G3]|eukprot:XP_001583219.1 hypothetical protein [Trichomonas vaginalis G3]